MKVLVFRAGAGVFTHGAVANCKLYGFHIRMMDSGQGHRDTVCDLVM